MIIDYSYLYKKIGYKFKNKKLITQALTHRSTKRKNNERLEFLGDAILGFIISEEVYNKFPYENEGNLSLLRTYIVKGKTLANMAKFFNLGELIFLGSGEIKSGGNKRDKLLEDAFEAIIGAIYLDSDIFVIKKLILFWFRDILNKLNIEEFNKDPKSKLQEYLQSKLQEYPEYTITNIYGLNHDQTFEVEVKLKGLNKKYSALGKSKKQAEQYAAKKALANIKNKRI